jgi:hypothetical protein
MLLPVYFKKSQLIALREMSEEMPFWADDERDFLEIFKKF